MIGADMQRMLARFSLYGFLKNQQYFEPFLILALLEKGLSFLEIGILVGFREVCRNVLEIPSGAAADLYGRRRSMMVSFVAYIGSFCIFGASGTYWQFFPAMLFFAVGDAFRTGTHKAMIFTWLRIQGRIDEKTEVYGYTRSWSKIGSAVSVIIAAVLVFTVRSYSCVFYLSVIPYLLGLINFMGYPAVLDGAPVEKVSWRVAVEHLGKTLKMSVSKRPLRHLMLESMGFEGIFNAAKDYLQPILQAAALGVLLLPALGDRQRSAVLVGAVYFVLHLVSAAASRKAHRWVGLFGDEIRAARGLWGVNVCLYALLVPLLFFEVNGAVIIGFVALHLTQNLWRPILISRFDAHASETVGATVLSIESQAKSLSTVLVAPTLGYAVDCLVRARDAGNYAHGPFWPVALLGAIVALIALVSGRKRAEP